VFVVSMSIRLWSPSRLNNAVKGFLERSGAEALPMVLVDGEVALAGRYPSRAELTRWAGILPTVTDTNAPGRCCSGSNCC
jgi:hypothetical protein